MSLRRNADLRADLWAVLLLLALPIVFFWPVLGGGQTLLPVDNLYQYLPWQADAAALGVGAPHNSLLSDLILENYPWKRFILDALHSGQLPLWNPGVLAGVPFLAAGQHAALYPLIILYYVLPLSLAYGVYSALTFFLAALGMHILLRVLGGGPFAGLAAGITYAFSGFFVVSVVFPMIIGAATWLPWLLAVIELLFRQRPGPRLWLLAVLGALLVGVQFLAGHVEIAYYNMMVAAFYTIARAILVWRQGRNLAETVRPPLSALLMVLLGLGLGGVQVIPLLELVTTSFREGSAAYKDIIGWAYPARQIVTFFIPDFFGNPAHHSYFDLLTRTMQPITRNAAGEQINSVFWGIKNYVEAGSYAGILPLLLAAVAVLRRAPRAGVFAVLAVLSLLFAFGTPLYAILFYGLPGYSQLHSAFRWVYPFTLCVAVLAGLGLDSLARHARQTRPPWLSVVPFGAGLIGLLGVALVALAPAPFADLAGRLVQRSDLAQRAFADGGVFLSYEARNLFLFFAFVAGAGAVLLLAGRRWRWWRPAAVALIAVDLFIIGFGFNPRADPALLQRTPKAIAFLLQDKDVFRIATLDRPNEKLFNQNGPMIYGLQDIRGYDSIIPRRYTEYMSLMEGQGELLYNRIAPFYWPGSLDSRLLDLLNVKYVLTTQPLANPSFTQVYGGEVLIYRNEDYLPRAFVVEQARVIGDQAELAQAMKSLEPQREVLLEEPPAAAAEPIGLARAQSGGDGQAQVVSYSGNRVVISVSLPRPGYLVLTDSYFPGWVAQIKTGDESYIEAPILRADYNFRAVALGAGVYEVTFRYSPMSFKVGGLASLLSTVVVLLVMGAASWRRFYREERSNAPAGAVRRVAKNSLLPMIANLGSRLIDLAFAIIVVRILGPEGQGRFALAIAFIGYFDIFTNFGLNVLLTREVAGDHSKRNFFLGNTVVLRLLLWLVSLPFIAGYIVWMNLPFDTSAAIILFALGLVPSNMSTALSSVFNAYEKMEYPAAVTIITAVLKVAVGAAALLAGYGIAGLAGASVLVNTVTAIVLFYLVYNKLFRPRLEFERRAAGQMLVESWPLMINHFLATIFFRIDALLMKPLLGPQSDAALGYYSTAYKFIDGLNIIPSYLTLAIFPLMSRYAREAHEALQRAYLLSLRLLILIALPLSVGTTILAHDIIGLLFGPKMLPGSGEALAVLIWFLPFSFINSVTQYALIAVNQQRFLTRAFVIGAAFNLAANIVLIPRYSYIGAAITTVASELVLFLPFYYAVHRHIMKLPFLDMFWRPVLASAVMGALAWLLLPVLKWLVAPLAALVYVALLLGLGAVTAEDRAVLHRLRHGGDGLPAPDVPGQV